MKLPGWGSGAATRQAIHTRGMSPCPLWEQNIQGFIFEPGYFYFESRDWDPMANKVCFCFMQGLSKVQ